MDRLVSILEADRDKIVFGGDIDLDKKFIEPS